MCRFTWAAKSSLKASSVRKKLSQCTLYDRISWNVLCLYKICIHAFVFSFMHERKTFFNFEISSPLAAIELILFLHRFFQVLLCTEMTVSYSSFLLVFLFYLVPSKLWLHQQYTTVDRIYINTVILYTILFIFSMCKNYISPSMSQMNFGASIFFWKKLLPRNCIKV